MKMIDRINLKYSAEELAGFPALNKKQNRAVAKVLKATAKYFEKNPERWIACTVRLAANRNALDHDLNELAGVPNVAPFDRFCAIGVWENVPSALPAKAFGTLGEQIAPFRHTTVQERAADSVVEMNDGMSCVASVIEGLRTQALAFELAANGMEWNQAVKSAFAQNAHYLQVQQARKTKWANKG